MTLHILNDFDDADKKSNNYLVIANGKLIYSFTGSHPLKSRLTGSTSMLHVETLGVPRNTTSVLKAMPGKLDINKKCLSHVTNAPKGIGLA